MDKLAEDICAILDDYHRYNGFNFTPDHVLRWVDQFEQNDQKFVLEEFFHLLNKGIYISEKRATVLLLARIKELAILFKFKTLSDFLKNTEFIQLQADGKSQSVILKLLDKTLTTAYNLTIAECGTQSKKFIIYLDDILATGGTVFNDTKKWLSYADPSGQTNLDKVIKRDKYLIVSVFCIHTWPNIDWRLKCTFDNEDILGKIIYCYDYKIENHPSKPNQKLNFAYPDKNQSKPVIDYWKNLLEKGREGGFMTAKSDYAFRSPGSPSNELFYSSVQNRKRFEDIILLKGIEILNRTKKLKSNHRPLGAILPSYMTLGLGTLFFTWRNISNTTPVVFWWGANWYPLFELINRGN